MGCYNGVVCSSKLTWTSLLELKNQNISQKCCPEAETALEAMLLKADLFFQHKFDVGTASVCESHRDILLPKVYFSEAKYKCDVCFQRKRYSFTG